MNQNMYGVFLDISLQMETAVLNLFINSALFHDFSMTVATLLPVLLYMSGRHVTHKSTQALSPLACMIYKR